MDGIRKINVEGTVLDCVKSLQKKLPMFKEHTYIKRIQAKEFKMERESVKDDPNKVVIQIDFAENFTTKTQNEIQSAYWSHTQVTLFTVCAWESNGIHSMVIVSDSLHHDKYAVNVFLSHIFQHLDENVRPFESIVMFSDGASSQFKQRFLLYSLTLMNRDITWNFFATSHGKGPVDGIGGMAKRVVSREVMSGRASVQSSQEFAIVAANKCKETKNLHIGKEEIEATKLKLEEQFIGVNAIPHIQQIHRVYTDHEKSKLLVQKHASAPAILHTFIKKTVQERDDPNVDNCDPNDQQSDEVHSDNTIVASDIEDGTLTWKWVAVKYSEDRNAKRFIGQVIKSDVNYVTVKYLKSTAFDKYVWPEIDDIDAVHKSKIIDILNEPQMDRRSTLAF